MVLVILNRVYTKLNTIQINEIVYLGVTETELPSRIFAPSVNGPWHGDDHSVIATACNLTDWESLETLNCLKFESIVLILYLVLDFDIIGCYTWKDNTLCKIRPFPRSSVIQFEH